MIENIPYIAYICSMIELGKMNLLTVVRQETQGMYLNLKTGDPLDQVLLPNAYIEEGLKIGDEIEVFVYLDNEERITATTLKPKLLINQFANLAADQVNTAGAFMDMGIVKQLLVPYKEQAVPMEEGRSYVVYMYLDDKTGRLVATSKVNRYLNNDDVTLEIGNEVDLIVMHSSELGRNVIINNKYHGLIFNSDVNQALKVGQSLTGFVKKVRQDGKIDVILQQEGISSIEPNAQKVIDILAKNDGFLALNDKSDPELISKKISMSKKSFKKAIGNLYKSRKITISAEGIKLV